MLYTARAVCRCSLATGQTFAKMPYARAVCRYSLATGQTFAKIDVPERVYALFGAPNNTFAAPLCCFIGVVIASGVPRTKILLNDIKILLAL